MDNREDYAGKFPVFANTPGIYSLKDAPDIICDGRTRIDVDCVDYFRFKPGILDTNNIFVTLATTHWNAFGQTWPYTNNNGIVEYNQGRSNSGTSREEVDAGNASLNNQVQNSEDFPFWGRIVKRGQTNY